VSVDNACARAGDEVRCWGENDSGQLGDGRAPRGRPEAAPVAGWDRGQLRDVDGDGRLVLVCLGDSNTERMPGAWPPWCDRLPSLLPAGFRVVNRGQGGATASAVGLLDAAAPLAHALENDTPDVALLAYGTNDVIAGATSAEIVAATARHARRLLEAGVQPLIALAPPLRSADAAENAAVVELNAALRAGFPERWIVDFWSGFGDAQLVDRVHLNDAGQERRARIAAQALARFETEAAP
jgi:lysophospholipase L1-like esterase